MDKIQLSIFLFILSVCIVIGSLVEKGIFPSAGIWGIQYKSDYLQGVLIVSTALMALAIFVITHNRSNSHKKSPQYQEMIQKQVNQFLSWSTLGGFMAIISTTTWFMMENWISLMISIGMFALQIVWTFAAIILAKVLTL